MTSPAPGAPAPAASAASRIIAEALRPELHTLLHTDDAELIGTRLQRLDVSRSRGEDADRLDRLVSEMVVRRGSVSENLARALVALVSALIVAVVVLLVASFTASAFSSRYRIAWLDWPPSRVVVMAGVVMAGLAWCAGYAVVFLRSHDQLRRARRAVQVAAVHHPDTWPGLSLDAPFATMGRRLSYPGWSLVVAAVVLWLAAALAHRLGLGYGLLGLVWVGLGVLLVRLAGPYRQAQQLAERTLFIGRPD